MVKVTIFALPLKPLPYVRFCSKKSQFMSMRADVITEKDTFEKGKTMLETTIFTVVFSNLWMIRGLIYDAYRLGYFQKTEQFFSLLMTQVHQIEPSQFQNLGWAFVGILAMIFFSYRPQSESIFALPFVFFGTIKRKEEEQKGLTG
jgi:hypothetical protein